MLFDLRGRGRRRTIQVIYVTLALLMGGGLVFFGIGGNTAGGLLDAIGLGRGGGGSGGGSDIFAQRAKQAEQQLKVNPQDATAWAALARARFQQAGQGDNYDQARQTYTDKGVAKLRTATTAFGRYLALSRGQPDVALANQALQAIVVSGSGDPKTAEAAARIVAGAQPSANAYYLLTKYAYAAGDKRTGELAAAKTLELTPPGRKTQTKLLLDQVKKPQGSSAGAPAPAPSQSATGQ